MEKEITSQPSPPPSGGLISLQVRATDLITLLGPTWAAFCGVAASGSFGGQSQDWLRLALLLLLVDGGWGTLWAALGSSDWATPLHHWRDWQANKPTATLPYTMPGTPGARVSRLLGKLRAWWQEIFWPTCGSAVLAILVALPVTVLLGLFLGTEHLLLSVAALALMQLGLAWQGGEGVVPPGWDAAIAVALPWLAGHVTFGSVTLRSAGVAALFTLAWGKAWHIRSSWSRLLVIGSQLLATAVLILLRRPLVGGSLFLLLIPQLALIPWMRSGRSDAWYVRHTRPWLIVAMGIAALAL